MLGRAPIEVARHILKMWDDGDGAPFDAIAEYIGKTRHGGMFDPMTALRFDMEIFRIMQIENPFERLAALTAFLSKEKGL